MTLEERIEQLEKVAHTPKDLPDMKGYKELLARIEVLEKLLKTYTKT